MTTENIATQLAPLLVPIKDLQPMPGNPRKGDVDAVARSYARFGQRKPIVARRDGTVIAGNHQLKAAKKLGWKQIAVVYVDDDDQTAKAYALADNRIGDLGGYDDAALQELLAAVAVDVELLGATGYALSDLTNNPAIPAAPPADDAPAAPATPVSKLGDVWVLGNHRVICGDSADSDVYTRLLGGDLVDLVWTDPPYGVAYVGKTKDALTIENDRLDVNGLTHFLRATLSRAADATRPGGAWYVAAPQGPISMAFHTVLIELDVWKHSLIWNKDQFVLGRADYHYKHEAIYYGWKPGDSHTWESDRTQTSVLDFARPKRNADHPTMKPIALVEYCIRNSSHVGELVLDPFSGSGSTLLACEHSGRRARAIELDPRYVDVICRRWQEYTGHTPVLEATGTPHSFVKGTA